MAGEKGKKKMFMQNKQLIKKKSTGSFAKSTDIDVKQTTTDAKPIITHWKTLDGVQKGIGSNRTVGVERKPEKLKNWKSYKNCSYAMNNLFNNHL